MKLTFLGTAAAEGIPAAFCNCETCRRAKERGGKEIRTRSQILIDDDTLFDFPPDTYMHMLRFKLDLSAIKRVLITHSHMDHCYPQEFCMRGEPFAYDLAEQSVKIYCNSTVRDIFAVDTAREMRESVARGIDLVTLSPYSRVTDGDVEIVALPAKHTQGEECLVYYVRRDGVGALLLNDTGVPDVDMFRWLKDNGCFVDIATFDSTYGARRRGAGGRHMGLYDVVDQIEIMHKIGLLNVGAKTIATHFSHNTDLDHAGICAVAQPYDIIVAYDGYTAEAEKSKR